MDIKDNYTDDEINCGNCKFKNYCAEQEEAMKRNNVEELTDMYLICDAYEE
jgi:predicted nucleotide-binding protein (sugar kinase/HSP70/actin superfamily)